MQVQAGKGGCPGGAYPRNGEVPPQSDIMRAAISSSSPVEIPGATLCSIVFRTRCTTRPAARIFSTSNGFFKLNMVYSGVYSHSVDLLSQRGQQYDDLTEHRLRLRARVDRM